MRTDWTPRTRGKFYGSPACCDAKFCTRADFDLATERAAKLAARMGVGWEIEVWENLGWHYKVSKGLAEIYPSIDNTGRVKRGTITGYTCYLQFTHQFIADAKTPEDALGFAVQDARGFERKIASELSALSN